MVITHHDCRIAADRAVGRHSAVVYRRRIMSGIPTTLTVRVIARDGKFLGDDIGGAYITVRDALTKRLLVEGATSGGSGPNGCDGVMCVKLRRGEPLPTTGA